MNLKIKNWTYILLTSSLAVLSCKKLVEVEPPQTTINGENVFENDKTATAAIQTIYIKMSREGLRTGSALNGMLSYYAGLSADEFGLLGTASAEELGYYRNRVIPGQVEAAWGESYANIFLLNSAVEGLQRSENTTPVIRQNLLGASYFLRAFHYFYLVNLYGPVPLVLSTDYSQNRLAPRAAVEDVYKQIIEDLKQADNLLPGTYVNDDAVTSTDERTIPIKWAAKALLARVYLYHKDYAEAERYSGEVIANTNLYGLELLKDVFIKNSREAIWQLQPVNNGWNTEDARLFVIPENGLNSDNPVYLNQRLVAAFETTDQRKIQWIGAFKDQNTGDLYYYPAKYRLSAQGADVNEYEMVLRLGEQFLIRAEARAHLGLGSAIDDLDAIRLRAGLDGYKGATGKDAVLQAIYEQRRLELFSEWGHRWLDLKRTETVNTVMSQAAVEKGGAWNADMQFYPLPPRELKFNPNLTQNAGY